MDIESILIKMTLEEKLLMLGGSDGWHFYGVERLGVPGVRVCDGPHGIRVHRENVKEGEPELDPATNFPCASAMAATFNPELIRNVGRVIGEECRHYGVDVLLGPGSNGKRSPLAGRNFEYYSEDPYLTGVMATSFIQGVQSTGVGTSMKHFIANEQETSRLFISSKFDERTMREIYLLPFEMAVKEANPWTIMASYNRINGKYGCENPELLIDILRKEWGYDGVVVSDWGAVNDKIESIKHGLDIQMPGKVEIDDRLRNAVEKQEITMETLDDHVRNCLRLIQRVQDNKKTYALDLDKNHAFAQQVAGEAIVLLKNDGILPLEPGIKLGVIGRFADDNVRYNGGGSSYCLAYKVEKPIEALRYYADVRYAGGYDEEETNDDLLREALEVAKNADKVVLFAGTTSRMESEGYDRWTIELPDGHRRLIEEVAKVNPNLVVVLNNGAAVATRAIEASSRAIVEAWFLGSASGQAIADILFGKTNPSGKLSETFPMQIEHTPAYLNFPGIKDEVVYQEGVLTGYRHYDTRELPVAYPFGHGLSYSAFALTNLQVEDRYLTDGKIIVNVDITNVSERFGGEVVQLYLHDEESYEVKAKKELKRFAKVFLQPQETRTLTFTLEQRDFAYYCEPLHRFAVEEGKFSILLGTSSRDIRLTHGLFIPSTDLVRPPMTLDFPYNMWIKYPSEKAKIDGLVAKTRMPHWWETEPPLKRWLHVLRHEFNWSDAEYEEIKKRLSA